MFRRIGVAAACLVLVAATAGPQPFRIEAVQHKGWWELRYPDGTVCANEIHIPVGRRVVVDAKLDGVGIIWFDKHLPRLGRGASVAFDSARRATFTASAWRFEQPRRTKLIVIADDRFDQWLAWQRSRAIEPATRDAAMGRDIFLTARCTLCHTVRGAARAEEPVGPDLTHVASRSMLAAGSFPNRPGFLAGWVVDAETLKPGAGMPINNIASRDLQSLLAYLRSLR